MGNEIHVVSGICHQRVVLGAFLVVLIRNFIDVFPSLFVRAANDMGYVIKCITYHVHRKGRVLEGDVAHDVCMLCELALCQDHNQS